MAELKQVARDFVNPISWVRIIVVLLILFGAFKLMSKPTQNVTIGQGGTAKFYNAGKRFLIPFVEVFTGKEKNYSELNYGMRAGIRFEF